MGSVVAADTNTTDDFTNSVDDTIIASENNNVIADDSVQDLEYRVYLDTVTVTVDKSFNYNVKVTHPSKSVDGLPVTLSVEDSNYNVNKYVEHTNNHGVACFNLKLGKVGEYKTFTETNFGNIYSINYGSIIVKDSVKDSSVDGGKLVVKAPGIKVCKGSGVFKVTVVKGKVPVSGLKLKIKIGSGKKVKTYTRFTNKEGLVKVSVKSLKIGSYKVKVISDNKKYKFKKNSKIIVKKKSNVKSVTMKIYDSYVPYSVKKLRTGDKLIAFYEVNPDRQYNQGVYIGTNIDPGQDGQHSTKLLKAKIYFKRVVDDKVIVKVVKSDKSKLNIKTVKWDRDMYPYKVTVWYKKR